MRDKTAELRPNTQARQAAGAAAEGVGVRTGTRHPTARAQAAGGAVQPTPYTLFLHHTPYALIHPTPYALHPPRIPYTLNLAPSPYTLHSAPSPDTMHPAPSPYTLHPTPPPYTLHPTGGGKAGGSSSSASSGSDSDSDDSRFPTLIVERLR